MITWNARNAIEFNEALASWARQIPYATSVAINDTAKQIQENQRQHQGKVFEIRRPHFFNRAVKIAQFARRDSLTARIAIDPPGGIQNAPILTRHEKGGVRRPMAGGRALAVPIEARRTRAGVVRRNERPRSFQFQRAYSSIGTRTEIYLGNRRTFMIRKADGSGTILRRYARGQSGTMHGVVTLYRLVPQANIAERLRFHLNSQELFRDRFAQNFQVAFRRAVETAR